MNKPGATERLARNDGAVVIGAVTIIVLLSGAYTFWGVGMQMSAVDMTRMARPIGAPMAMGGPADWTLAYGGLIFLMWWIMMIAMMTPSAAPTLLLFAALRRNGGQNQNPSADAGKFLAGYLIAWGAFSLAAASMQWALGETGIVAAQMMTISSRAIAGAIVLLAGAYQFSALKNTCLKHCQSPAQFLTVHRRSGAQDRPSGTGRQQHHNPFDRPGMATRAASHSSAFPEVKSLMGGRQKPCIGEPDRTGARGADIKARRYPQVHR